MPSGLSQGARIAALHAPGPLGGDVLVLTRFEGVEGLSELFEYRIEAISEKPNLDFTPAIGQNCCVQLKSYKGERFFNGKLVEAQWVGVREHDYAYRIVLRPWLWLLSHRTNCLIFEKMTAPDVIKKVFSNAGLTDFEFRLSQSYTAMEYCVQYRETDFAFVSRLMEQYGIYHYFEHSKDKHTLVLADGRSAHRPVAGGGSMPFNPVVERHRRDREHIYQWTKERRFRTSKVVVKDYDFLQPSAELLGQHQASEGYTPKLEAYDFPGKYPRSEPEAKKKRDDGDFFARVRLEAEQAADHRRHCAGDAALLYPGGVFTLTDHPTGEENGQHLVVRASHAFTTEHYRSSANDDMGDVYYGNYELLRCERPFRAPLVTPKPLIHGPQTAQVIGAKGEEIDVDKHGRIKVRFHWDREGKDDKQARRVRVAQIWSGKTWGGQVIPRIGQEVVVEFLDGDPDRPLVVGTVYNEEYKYPYELPANKTMSGVKSDSTKGGGGFNEFKFEDKKKAEKVSFRAEKDHDVLVRDSEKTEIGEAFTAERGPASRDTALKQGDDKLAVETGHQQIAIAQDQTLDVGSNQTVAIGKNQTINVGQKIEIEAGTEIVLKVGLSQITMKKDGSITIKGMRIDIEGGVQTQVKGSAFLILKGGIVTIN